MHTYCIGGKPVSEVLASVRFGFSDLIADKQQSNDQCYTEYDHGRDNYNLSESKISPKPTRDMLNNIYMKIIYVKISSEAAP